MMDDFHVVILSNVKNVSDEINTIGSFRTYLPKLITLDKNEWHVALVQIDFTIHLDEMSVGKLQRYI